MAKRRYVLFRDQLKEFYKKGLKSKVIGMQGTIILAEVEVPEENENMNAYRTEEAAHEPGEC